MAASDARVEGSRVDATATLYRGVTVLGSTVGAGSVVADNCDILRSRIGSRAEVGRRNLILGSSIGDCTYTGSNCVVSNASVGRYCCVSWNVGIGGGNHDYRSACMLTPHYWERLLGVGPSDLGGGCPPAGCSVGNGVWIAQGAIICGTGVTVGNGAVVGAGATVISDVPPFAVVVGTPARVMKYRFDRETVERLEAIAWWDWDRERVASAAALLSAPVDDEVLDALERC